MSSSVSSVSSVKAYSSYQGQPVEFQVHLDKATAASQKIKFTFEQPDHTNSGSTLDANDYYYNPNMNSNQKQEFTGYVVCSDGVKLNLKTDTIYVPKGVKDFTLDFKTTTATHETLQQIDLGFKVGKSDIVAGASVIPQLVYNNNYWWRSTPWFNNEMGTISKEIMSNAKNLPQSVVQAYNGFQALPTKRLYFAYCSAVEAYLTTTDKYKFNALTVTQNGVTVTSRKDLPAPKSNSKEIMIVGDSISDEELSDHGVWTRSLRKDVEVTQSQKGWDVWNVATRSSPTSSSTDPFNALNQLKGALAVNPHPGIIILNTGVNNYHLKISVEQSLKDFNKLLALALGSGAQVILVGTHLPPGSITQYNPSPSQWNRQDIKTFKKDGLYKKLIEKKLSYGDCYSQAFQIMMDYVATQYKKTPQFHSVKDFWDPMKSNDYMPDGIHPKHQAAIENLLAQPIINIVNQIIGLPPKRS